MNEINLDDHLGTPLPEDQQLPHERQANKFMDIARDQMARLYPGITFSAHPLTQADIHMGTGAERALREWDSPEMAKYRDKEFDAQFKELSEEQAEMGRQADVESAELTRIATTMLGDSEAELRAALRSLSILAGEKGGSLEQSEVQKNFLAILHQHRPDEGYESFAKELMQTA